MNKQTTKKLLIFLLVFGVISSSVTIFATAKSKSIRASLDPNYRYTFNNQSILDRQPTIVYNGKAYVPVETLASALGYNVNIKNHQVAITTPPVTKPTPPPAPAAVTIPRAEIIAIDFGGKTVTILPEGKVNRPENQIILHVNDQTTITDGRTKRIYTINDLNTGIPVKVVHSAAMTFSIPPQTQAISITLL